VGCARERRRRTRALVGFATPRSRRPALPIVRPFRALRYGHDLHPELDRLVSPATVGEPTDRQTVGGVDARNIRQAVRGRTGPLARPDAPPYTHAGRLLQQWKEDGVLIRDPRPAMYALEQADEHGSRRGLITLVRLAPLDSDEVRPHEAIRDESTAELHAQLAATRTQLSLVMGIVPDRQGVVAEFLGRRSGRPLLDVVDGAGTRCRLFSDEDPALHLAIHEALRSEVAVIADGHHRWTAALRHQATTKGPATRETPVDYAMMLLVPVDEPGLRCGPSHRVLPDPLTEAQKQELERLLRPFDEEPLTVEQLDAFLAAEGGVRLALAERGRLRGLVLRDPGALDAIPEPLRGVDAAAADALLLDWLDTDGDAGRTQRSGSAVGHNRASANDVAARALAGELGLAVLLRPVRPAQVLAAADASLLMPPKSTNFVPKPTKGLVMSSLVSF
jgi:uncharacterized protein (DUF1015 family)